VVGFHAIQHLGQRHEVIGVSRSPGDAGLQADLGKPGELERAVEKARPDAVINAVKPPISVDRMEEEKGLAYEMNTALPENAARLGKKHGFKLVQISTGGLYEGKEGETYDESSLIYPKNYYMYTKAIAEERIRCTLDDHLILRTEGVFGHDKRGSNFFERMKKATERGEEFPAAQDQFSQPIYGGALAVAIGRLLEKGSEGTYNATGKDYVSRYEFACMIRDAFGWETRIRKQPAQERKIPFPLHLRVNIGKLEKEVGKMPGLDQQLAELKDWVNVQQHD
jgi:dTDP-4-dehydrorhamnose reductase